MRRVLLGTTAVVLCLSLAPASAQQAITTPILATAPNFRDLAGISVGNGGTGFVDPTSNNGVMRTGVFYRSDLLFYLAGTDLTTISNLNIRRDIDLRTPTEYFANPDVAIGATLTHVNIYGTLDAVPLPPVTSAPLVVKQFMWQSYQAFVTDPVQRAGFGTVLTTLAHDDDADLYHCSGGKDRTGWTSAILQSIAGVSPATIMKDYLATNNYTAAFIAAGVAQAVAAHGFGVTETATLSLGVDSTYLQAGLTQMIATYGSLDAYLMQGLGLTQADIYVLRAKMVYFQTLPGQSAMVGNAAAGAAFLGALQNSPLSGRYTAYNYYLQSAIDAGTLGGVETQAGGQVHADAAAYVLRQPLWIDTAITPYASGRDLAVGKTSLWLAGVGGYFGSDGHAGAASSTERSGGSIIGATYRIDQRASAYVGIGDVWGQVASAGGSADVNTAVATIGARFAFSTLDAGPYVAARANAGWVDYQSRRALGGGLGTTRGDTAGAVYGGRADLGDVVRLASWTITPQVGVRVTQVLFGSFNESGSDLALSVDRLRQTSSSVLADLDVGLDPQRLDDWTVAPSVAVGYERALGSPQVASSGSIYGYTVSQYSAYDSRNLAKIGLAVIAQREAVTVKAGLNAVRGDDASSGLSAQLSVGYRF